MTQRGRLGAAGVALLLAVLVPFALFGELPGARWLATLEANALAFGLGGAALLVADTLLPVPSSVVGTLLGARLGLGWGFACTWAGLSLGNLVGYAIGRLWPARWMARDTGDWPVAPGLLLLFASRPVPVLAETAMLAAGAARLPPGRAVLCACAGSAVYALVLTGIGAALLAPGWLGPGLLLPMLLPALGWLAWRAALPQRTAGRRKGG